MKLSIKINIFIILIIFIQYLPFSLNIKYEYIPEVLSLVIYIMYSSHQKTLSYPNLILLSLLNDMINLCCIGVYTIQYLIYAFYIDELRRRYSNDNLLIGWLGFFVLNILLLPCKYALLNFIQEHDITFNILVLKKTLMTIAWFPMIYYFINRFIK